MKRRSTSGFTILELAIAATIMAVVLGGTALAMRRGLELNRWMTADGDLNSRSARGLSSISRRLFGAGLETLDPDLTTLPGEDTVWSETLDLELGSDWAGGEIQWGEVRRIALEFGRGELDNGVDDNGDGLVDEQMAVLIVNPGEPDQRRAVLVSGVSEYLEGEVFNGLDDNGNGLVDERGLCFALEGELLTIRLSVERLGPDGRLMVRTQETTIGLRN